MEIREKLLDEKEAADYCGLDAQTMKNARQSGFGPRYVKPTPRKVMYRPSDLETWIQGWDVSPIERELKQAQKKD